MRKLLLLFLVICCVNILPGLAQVTMILQVPPAGIMQKSQLWNMALVYGGNGSVSVSVNLTLLNAKDNQPVFTAMSKPIILNKGTNQLNGKDLAPIDYNYLSPLFNADRDPNGFLPVGSYKACYTVAGYQMHGGTMAEDCIPVDVQPLSPPQLNTPTDTVTLEMAYPQFSWLPPMPINLFSNLTYDMLVVEVQPGQGAYEAIQKNIPVYNISHYKDVLNIYPSSNKALDTGRVYAWRVIAKNEDEFVAQSEVWTFKVAKVAPAVIRPKNGNYVLLRNINEKANGLSLLDEPILGIKYYSFEKDHLTAVRFLGSDGQVIREEQTMIKYGDNFFGFQLNRGFQKGKQYRVVITDSRQNQHIADFILK